MAGALAVVLAVLSYRGFDLDRFFVPKELALHVTALVAGLVLLAGARRIELDATDLALASWLALSVLSALFATNHWLAYRALTLTVSGAVAFWCARGLAENGYSDALANGLALAVVVAACISLAEAYGAKSTYFALNRAPGGTLGNRNFVAHLAAIGVLPLLYVIAAVRSRLASALWTASLAACSAVIVLSRTRAAWLALGVCGVVVLVVAARGPSLLDDAGAIRRVRRALVAAAAGVLLALLLPNVLDWRSNSPYLDSVRGVVNFREGSGKGRLRQYENSMRITAAHPLLGAGPGNWPVVYPHFAPPDDPSLVEGTGTTANPWPSSDWMAALSERGVPATLALCGFVVLLLAGALRTRYDTTRRPAERLAALAGAATLGVAVVEGGFDAVLLLSVPALVSWVAVGALIPRGPVVRTVALTPRTRIALMAVTAAFCLSAAVAGTLKIEAMRLYGVGTISALEQATMRDPGSYRIRLRAAEAYAALGQCGNGRRQATAARNLLPAAAAPKRLLERCR